MKEFFKDSKNIIILILIIAICVSLLYWYACMHKGVCKMRWTMKGDTKTEIVKDVSVLDGKIVFENISKTPLVIYFDASSTKPVVAQMDAELKALAKYASENSKNIYVTGHSKMMSKWTDSQKIGLDNAESVKKVLLDYGATSTKVFVSSKSSNNPVYNFKNTDEVNNRAVISVDYYRQ